MKIISGLCSCSKPIEFKFSAVVNNSCLCSPVVEKSIELLPNLCICPTISNVKTTLEEEEVIITNFKSIIKFNNVKYCN